VRLQAHQHGPAATQPVLPSREAQAPERPIVHVRRPVVHHPEITAALEEALEEIELHPDGAEPPVREDPEPDQQAALRAVLQPLEEEPTDQGQHPAPRPQVQTIRADPPADLPVLERIDWRLAQIVEGMRGDAQMRGAELELEFRRAEDEHALAEVNIHGRRTCVEAARKYLLDNPRVAGALAGGAVGGISASTVLAVLLSALGFLVNAWASGQLDLPGLP
jgi:hypothetical protein